jgi:uncharacterized lipoprotein YmbA
MKLIPLVVALGIWLSFFAFAFAQSPTPTPSIVPDWVVKYASGQEQARKQCDLGLAQEQDKTDKLTKELADAKAALAKSKPAEEKK